MSFLIRFKPLYFLLSFLFLSSRIWRGLTFAPMPMPMPMTSIEHSNFYRRLLPSTCISFSSKEGRKIFQSSLLNQGLKSFYSLIEQHSTQSEPSYCGPSTLVIVLNALAVDPRRKWKGPWRWYDEHMLNCCIDLEEVKTTGITLSTFICLARCQGLNVYGQYASECSVDQFREAIRESCMEEEEHADGEQHKFLVVSYNRRVLGQTGTGHFSPIAAYDPASDSVLILDTARFKYGAHWVSVPLLFSSMQKLDPTVNKSRGFVMLSTAKDTSMDLLESILFRTKQSHKNLWQKYEDYLQSLSNNIPTLDEVYSYWTQDDANPLYVSELLIPQYLPFDTEGQKQVRDIIKLLSKLIQNYPKLQKLQSNELDTRCATFQANGVKCSSDPNKTCGGDSTAIPIGCAESIFIIYLASFKSSKERMDVIKGNLGDDEMLGDYSLNQILAEAELVKLAMDVNHLFEK